MYFDNIGNTELNKLPKVYMPNFNIKLSVALTHDLFKVETIITDKIYRIYPLFNCKSIQSSNPNDKIFENKLIICTKETTETYLTFISDENEEIQDFNNMGTYFDIGDSLSIAQYNDIVLLERINNTIINPIHIQANTFTTDYASYDFKIDGLVLDNGIAISSLTNLKVKLTNPTFNHSTYTLNLKALRITNTNIEEIDDNNKIIIPISVELVDGEYINIPTDDLEVGDVILYNCDVVITHDKPTIDGIVLGSIVVSTDGQTIAEIGETLDLSATLHDIFGQVMEDVTVSFLIYQEDSVIATLTADTDEYGIATQTYTCSGGDITIVANAFNCDSNSIDVEVTKLSTDLSINVPALIYSDVFDVTGVLKEHTSQNVISGASVKLYMEHNSETTLQATETTDANGEVTFHRSAPTEIEDYIFWLVFEGNSTYSESESGKEHRSVGKETSVLTVTLPANASSYPFGVNVGVMGTLLSNDGEAIKNASIVVSENNTTLVTLTTGNNGGFSGNISGLTAGSHTLKFVYAGDEYYTDCTIDNRSITVNAVASVILTADKTILSYVDSESATLTAIAKDGANNVVPGVTVSFDIVEGGVVVENIGTATTDSSGVCSVEYQSKDSVTESITATCNNVSSTSVTIENCRWYDPSNTNNVQNYTTSGLSFSYDSTENAYSLQNTNANSFGSATVTGLSIPSDVLIEADINQINSNNDNHQFVFKINNLLNRLINVGGGQRQITLANLSYSDIASANVNISYGTWYHMILSIENGTATLTLKQGDTTLGTINGNVSSLISSSNSFSLLQGYDINQKTYVKNIKIKSL